MKSTLLITVLLALSIGTQADCIRAYQSRINKGQAFAEKVSVALMLISLGTFSGAAAQCSRENSCQSLAATSGATLLGSIYAYGIAPYSANRFSKSLNALEKAAAGKVSHDMYRAVNRKVDLDSMSSKDEMTAYNIIIKTLNKLNKDESICKRSKRGKVRVLSHRKLSKIVAKEVISNMNIF